MRGVLYITWPGPDIESLLQRSIDSVKLHHPELPIHLESLPEGTLLDKAMMHELSPYEETLFLDADTVVLDRLDFGFDKASKHGMACCICECPWARRFDGLNNRPDIVEYNTGVIFFRKSLTEAFFHDWIESSHDTLGSVPFVGPEKKLLVMPINDQASFAVAASERPPFVLPMNWNLRPIWQKTFFGPVKVWHDRQDVPQGLLDWNAAQTMEGSVIQFCTLS